MKKSLSTLLQGYKKFRQKYAMGDQSVMQSLSDSSHSPEIMILSCCDSRVDPAILLQCDPGDLFVVRNFANIIPPHEEDSGHHGTSAALEFAVRILEIKQLVLLAHSECSGIKTLMSDTPSDLKFVNKWMSIINKNQCGHDIDACAKHALHQSYENCFTFPWVRERFFAGKLIIHLWFFDIKSGKIFNYSQSKKEFEELKTDSPLLS